MGVTGAYVDDCELQLPAAACLLLLLMLLAVNGCTRIFKVFANHGNAN